MTNRTPKSVRASYSIEGRPRPIYACSTHVEYPSVDIKRTLGGGVARVRDEDEEEGDGGDDQGDDEENADSEGE